MFALEVLGNPKEVYIKSKMQNYGSWMLKIGFQVLKAVKSMRMLMAGESHFGQGHQGWVDAKGLLFQKDAARNLQEVKYAQGVRDPKLQ